MLETLDNCPICQNKQFSPFLVCKDYTVSKADFQIVKCKNCQFVFTNPRPSEQESGQYYQSENYISHSNTKKGLINQMYQIVRQRALKGKLKLVNQLINNQLSNKQILDYGCGTGAFLEVCKAAGWKVEGIEPDEKARVQAIGNTGQEIRTDVFNEYFDNARFDVITLWHVLEHVHRLDETLIRLKSLLKDTGVLLIAVPNCASKDAQNFQQHWAAYDVPRHLYHFSPDTMEKLLQKHQLKLLKYLPMYYDAFYISMLSQKYKNGKVNYPLAFWQGWQSNRWAKKNLNNYSSVIYLITK
jgi:2-polyprenyl-3-methyl-5-hydroxy-6-metoxy-1,4-benzoquinol methylase